MPCGTINFFFSERFLYKPTCFVPYNCASIFPGYGNAQPGNSTRLPHQHQPYKQPGCYPVSQRLHFQILPAFAKSLTFKKTLIIYPDHTGSLIYLRYVDTVKLRRPLRRLALSTRLPPGVAIRALNPCLLRLLRRWG
jgi:hypothetical protein